MNRYLTTTLGYGLALLLFSTQASSQTADVQIIHNSPDPAASTVDIYVNDGIAVPDLPYRGATPVVPLPAGVPLEIAVAPGNSNSSADGFAFFDLNLTDGAGYVVMAAGYLSGGLPANPEGIDTTFNLFITALETSAPAGQVSLLAFHGAPDAPTVDILAQGVGPLFQELSFTEFSAGYLSVPAADYTLDVTLAGSPGDVVASYGAPLSGLGGSALVAFASGFLTDDTFGLFAALTDGTVIPLPEVPTPVEESTWGRIKGLYLQGSK